jgi:hypothetical protein
MKDKTFTSFLLDQCKRGGMGLCRWYLTLLPEGARQHTYFFLHFYAKGEPPPDFLEHKGLT